MNHNNFSKYPPSFALGHSSCDTWFSCTRMVSYVSRRKAAITIGSMNDAGH
jgi:hypothetical protein